MFVTFEWKVGNDEFGHMLSDILKQNGVDNSGLLFDENARTALAFHSLKSHDGKPEFMFYRNPSADTLFCPEEIDKEGNNYFFVFKVYAKYGHNHLYTPS